METSVVKKTKIKTFNLEATLPKVIGYLKK